MATKSVRKLSRNAHRQQVHRPRAPARLGTPERPRLCVYRSLGHIYAQVIDDQSGRTLVSASSLDKETRNDSQGRRQHRGGQNRGQDHRRARSAPVSSRWCSIAAATCITAASKRSPNAAREAGLKF